MSLSLRQIRYFVAVAEHGSVSATAHAISISQSAITEKIQDLEADLGFRLFERHSRGVELTLKGHQFLRHARKILTDLQDARRALRGEIVEGGGVLSLGVTPLVAGYVLPDLVTGFSGAFPETAIDTVEESGQQLEHLLVGGELDVAVMVLPVNMIAPALHTELVQVSPYRVWLPLGHRETRKVRVSLKDLADTPHVLLTVDQVAQNIEAAWRELGIRPTVALRTSSVEAVRGLVATGGHVAIMPDLTYRPWSLDGDKVEARMIEEQLPPMEVAVAWRHGFPLSPTATGFVATATTRNSTRRR
ncbi:MAG: LysR substrate-binding domain-containing protein [Hyphomicrobium sp.]|uniref:LysR substrate-binding domain-containing protein n=1 Tax=Hyphomicrobium sp. TaxID=82 RepID=UPI003D0F58A2